MKTTLLGHALPNVLSRLKEMLTSQGFLVQTIPTANPVLVAVQKGSWFRKPKQLVLEVSSVEDNLTRIDITAIVKSNTHAESTIEESYAKSIYNSFKKSIQQSYGFR